ncbi:DNRLRE domain-containing protein [Actinomadura geliboluensis]|uniref:golvesin C-terminal-like domain-containing protein n=1 Tax=Actinomadura geliboluensis TaxID=882440 RepID=UPI00371D0464
MSRFRRLLAAALAVVLALALAPPARAQQPPAGAEASDPGDGWKPESKRNAWDRFKGLFGDDDPKPRKLPDGGVPRNEPRPQTKKAAPAKRVKELTGRRTANTKIYQLSDGRLQKELSAVPLHYRGKDGRWRDIDPRIKPTDRKGFVYGNQTNTFDSFFGTRPDELVTFAADGAALTLGVPQAKPGKPKADSRTITYADLLGGADVSYEIARDALKEKIVLDTPPKDGTYAFTIKADGVRAWQRPDGSIAFYKGDFDGRPVFILPKPFMYDSKTDASSPYGKAWSPKVTQSMRWDAKAGLLHITVHADTTWLNDPKRSYPVVIDPTIKIAPTPTQSQDTMISSDGPDQNYDDSWRLSVGTTNSGKSRALLKFPLDDIPAGTRIDSAQLQLYYDQNHTSGANAVTLEARRATQAWDETSATWNSANGITGELSGNTEQVDDGDPGKTALNGTWSKLNTFDGSAVGNDLYISKNATTGDSYTWVPRVTETGTYQVQAHYKQYDDAATTAPYTVTYNGGSKVYTVDQSAGTAHAGVWKTLGSHPFTAGTQGSVKLGDVSDSSKRVVADAVRLFKEGTAVRPAGDDASAWHSFSVRDTVQHWLDGSQPNYGFVVKARDENTLGQGGPRYEGSLFFYNGETATYPKLVVTYGRPGVEVNPPTTIHATGADLTWPAYNDPSTSDDDDIVEYQVHRSVWQTFTPSQATLIAPVVKDVRSYTDTTAQPTPADSTDPFGNSYYYMVAVKTRDGKITPGPTQLARLPKAGRVYRIYQSGVTDTTLTASRPDENQDVLAGEPWLMAGNNSGTYGTSRAVLKFPDLTDIPTTARVLDAELRLWSAGVDPGGAGTYELRGLTRDFNETTATWNNANSTTAWTTPGGDMDATASGTGGNWSNDPQQRVLNATSLAQKWVTDPSTNHGAVVKLSNESAPTERAIFVSSEGREPQLRPQLVVTYLETTPENTYYIPATPAAVAPDSTQTVDVTLTNTTTSTWNQADWVLSYRWSRPDGSPVTVQQLHTPLPKNLVPGDAVTVQAQVKAPPPSTEGNKRVDHVLEWDMWNTTTSTWLSSGTTTTTRAAAAGPVNKVGALKQSLAVEESTSDQVGLEKFYAYAGKNTGAGSTVMNNLHAGNAVWQYNAFTNPSRGLATFLRLAYNSKDTSDTVAGYGWSIQASSLMRLGSPIDPHPNTHGRTVSLTDGDGTTHTFTLDDKDTSDPADDEYVAPAGVHYYLQRLAECKPKDEISRAWVMTRPDRTQFFFDCDGYLSSIEDNNGNRMDFTYEVRRSQNKPTKFLRYITDPAGRQTLTLDYWAKGEDYSYIDDATWEKKSGTGLTNSHIIDHVKSITDISGRTLTFTYSDKGLLGEIVDGAGSSQPKVFGFQYDATQGNKNVKLVKVTDPRGHATDLAYYDTPEDDPKFKWSLKTITDRLYHDTTFAYTDPDGAQGQQVQTVITDAENHATTYLMDGKGRPTQTTNARQQTTKLGWDDDNNVIRLEEPPAASGVTPAVSTWAYDPKTGYPTEIKDAEAVKNGWNGTRLTYQTGLNGHIADLIAKQSPEGRTSTFTYTSEGDLATVTDPIGNATSDEGDYTTAYTYDTSGQLKTATDANGHTTTNTDFDPNGYPRSITDPLQKSASFTYDERGQVTVVTDALNHTTTQAYDVYGRPLESKQPKDQTAGTFITTPAPEYDTNDNVVKATAPNGAVTTAVYDETDQVTQTFAPKDVAGGPERKSTLTYDRVGNIKTRTEPNGNLTATENDYTTTFDYNEINQLISVVNAKNDKITYTYDDAGNVVTVVDPRKSATTATDDYTTKYTYDLSHRVTVVTDAIGKTIMTAYDHDGLVTATTDQQGTTTKITLDARGKPIKVEVPRKDDGGILYNTTRLEYDQVGNQTKVISPRGVATATEGDFVTETVYDELNRVKQKLTPFDPSDDRYNTPNKTIYDYDAVGRLAKVSAPPSEGQTVRNDTVYTYFDNGWTKTSTDPWDIVTSYDYNDLGKQTNRTLTSAGGSSSRTMTWGYYPDGKLASRSDDGVPVGKQVVLVDDSDHQNAGSTGGTWTSISTGTGFQGYDYATHDAGTGTSSFLWKLTIPQDGDYEVFVKYPSVQGAAPDATYTIQDFDSSTTKTVDQGTDGGTWKSLGVHTFTKDGTAQHITLSDQATAGTTVLADAVKLVRDNTGETDSEKTDFGYVYDANGNLTDIADHSPGTQIDAYTVTYTGLNQVARVEEKNGAGIKRATGFTYDPNGNPATRTHETNGSIDQSSAYEYDPRDLPSKITDKDSDSDPAPKVTTFTYTSRGQRDIQTRGNGNTVDYDYFLDGLLQRQVEKKPNGVVVAEHALDYDPNSNKTRDAARKMNADNHGAYIETTTVWEYDPLERITKLTKTGTVSSAESYVHDANNNVISQTVKNATTAYTYDRNRLLTSVSGGVTANYNYDPFGRLDTVTAAGQIIERNNYNGFDHVTENQKRNAGGVTTTRYTYDPLDRTTTKTTNAGTSNAKTTTYGYLGLSGEVLDESIAGDITKTYQYSPWGERLSQVRFKPDSSPKEDGYYGYNSHTDVETVTDSTGDTKATYGYTAYGQNDDNEITGIDKPDPQNPTNEPYNPYRFNAKRWDSASGNYDMGFRNYSPGLNRFLTRDMYNGALADMNLTSDPFTGNRYGFGGGNPVSNIEFDGHCSGLVPISCGWEAANKALQTHVVDPAMNMLMGIIDTNTLGASELARSQMYGEDDKIDEDSNSYLLGEGIGMASSVPGLFRGGIRGVMKVMARGSDSALLEVAGVARSSALASARGAKVAGAVKYGSTDLAKAAINYRKKYGIRGGNVAVFEFAHNGKLYTIARESARGVGHSERRIAAELEKLGIKPGQVKRIYSELSPCDEMPGGYCKQMIDSKFRDAKVTWSFLYPGGRSAEAVKGREEAVRQLRDAVAEIF